MHQKVDMSTTIKFVYIHYFGDAIGFAKKGRFGVVHGCVHDTLFRPSHVEFDVSSKDDLTEDAVERKLREARCAHAPPGDRGGALA